EAVAEDLARHFLAAQAAEKAATYAFRAGLKSDRQYTSSRSMPYYQMATDLWESLSGGGGHTAERAAAYEKLGDAGFKSSYSGTRPLDAFQRSLALYEELGDRRKQATIHSQSGRQYSFGAAANMERSFEHFQRAREILEELPESMALGFVYIGLVPAVQAR